MTDLVAELETIHLGDQRLNERARQVLAALGAQPGASIPTACGGWAETKAAYRLFDHDRVGPQEGPAGAFKQLSKELDNCSYRSTIVMQSI